MKILLVAVVALIALARAKDRAIVDLDNDPDEENCHCGVFVGQVEIIHLHPAEDIEECNKGRACKKACKQEWEAEFGNGTLNHVHDGQTLGELLCEGAWKKMPKPNVRNILPKVWYRLCDDGWARADKAAGKLCCEDGEQIACPMTKILP